MIVQPSVRMQEAANLIMSNAVSGYTTEEYTFFSPLDASLRIVPTYVDLYSVVQRFHSNYTDEIQISVELPVADVLALLKNYQNLRCAIVTKRIDERTHEILTDQDPIIQNYRVIISNAGDLLKRYNRNELLAKDDTAIIESQHGRSETLVMQLLEDDIFRLRKCAINGLFKKATVQDLIYFSLNALGIKDAIVTPPDNTRVWNFLNLPPVQDISTVFDLIQKNWGIYAKGLSYYYTKGKFYLYPAYETNPSTKPVVHIYNVPSMNYVGSKGYHFIDGAGNIHILSNGDVQTKDMSAQGVENYGNYRVSLRTDKALDLNRNVSGSKGKFANDNILGCGLASDRGMVKGTQGAKYDASSNNAFVMASEMAAYDCTLLSSTWGMADPFLITPGQKVYYHYDEDETYKVSVGVVEEIQYTKKIANRSGKYIYTTTAAYGLRLAPDED